MSGRKRREIAKSSTTGVEPPTKPSLPTRREPRKRHEPGDHPPDHPYHWYSRQEKDRLDGTIMTIENNIDGWLADPQGRFDRAAARAAEILDTLIDGTYRSMMLDKAKRRAND